MFLEEKQSVSSNVTNSSLYQKLTCSSSKITVQQNSPMGQFSFKKKKTKRQTLHPYGNTICDNHKDIAEKEIRSSCQEGLT